MTNADRNTLLAEASALLKKSNFTREDSSRVESLLALSDRYEDQDSLRRATMAQRNRELGRTVGPPEPTPAYLEWRAYLANGKNAFTAERWAESRQEMRQQSTDTTAGGWLVPQGYSDKFEVALKGYDQLFDVATLWQPSTGSITKYPILEDTTNAAAIVAENATSASGPDLVFAQLSFSSRCPQYRSGIFTASVELVSDTNFDFGALVAQAVARRMAKGVGAAFVTALLSAATSAGTTAGATAITDTEIFTLVGSIDGDYAQSGSFLMRRSTLLYLRQLKGTGGAYLFPSERRADGTELLLGYPVYLSPSMGAISTGAKAVSFGDHSKFIRRQIGGLVVTTYTERYAEFGEIGYEGFLRTDGGLLKTATTTPVKYLLQA